MVYFATSYVFQNVLIQNALIVRLVVFSMNAAFEGFKCALNLSVVILIDLYWVNG